MSAEVVVVGAGVIGASVAYHLAKRGADVCVVDRATGPGEGSTGRATGGFRSQFATAINIRLSELAREELLAFEDELGVDPGYRPYGYLLLAESEETWMSLQEAHRLQRELGVAVREIGLDEIAELNPAVSLDGIRGGMFGETDGFVAPMRILEGYVAGARRLGVRFRFGEEVTGFGKNDVAVNATGAWAGRLGADVRPLRRQVAATEPTTILPETMPMTVFVDDGFHLRVRDGRVLLLRPDVPDAQDPFDTSFDASWLEGIERRAHTRVPCLAGATLDPTACWAGLYEMSPDSHAILGRAPGFDNVYLANGSSGHGVMHAPAIGRLLSELIVDGATSSLDITPLRPERFAEGELNVAPRLL